MARLACRQAEYVPEQLIRVPWAAEAPEIIHLCLAACRICSCCLAAGLATAGQHATADAPPPDERQRQRARAGKGLGKVDAMHDGLDDVARNELVHAHREEAPGAVPDRRDLRALVDEELPDGAWRERRPVRGITRHLAPICGMLG